MYAVDCNSLRLLSSRQYCVVHTANLVNRPFPLLTSNSLFGLRSRGNNEKQPRSPVIEAWTEVWTQMDWGMDSDGLGRVHSSFTSSFDGFSAVLAGIKGAFYPS